MGEIYNKDLSRLNDLAYLNNRVLDGIHTNDVSYHLNIVIRVQSGMSTDKTLKTFR